MHRRGDFWGVHLPLGDGEARGAGPDGVLDRRLQQRSVRAGLGRRPPVLRRRRLAGHGAVGVAHPLLARRRARLLLSDAPREHAGDGGVPETGARSRGLHSSSRADALGAADACAGDGGGHLRMAKDHTTAIPCGGSNFAFIVEEDAMLELELLM